jgi:hypothetical protein
MREVFSGLNKRGMLYFYQVALSYLAEVEARLEHHSD